MGGKKIRSLKHLDGLNLDFWVRILKEQSLIERIEVNDLIRQF